MVQYHAVKTSYDPGCLFATESTTARHSKQPARPSDYKPAALRWYYHVALITSFAVLIGLAEHSIRTLQVSYNPLVDLSDLQSLGDDARRALAAS